MNEKKEKKEEFRLSLRSIVQNLKETGERMVKLAEQMDSNGKGRPLNLPEKRLVRAAFVEQFKSDCEMLAAQFAGSHEEGFRQNIRYLTGLHKSLQDL